MNWSYGVYLRRRAAGLADWSDVEVRVATRLAQIGITLFAAAVVGTAWLLWVGAPSPSISTVLPQASRLSARLPANRVAVVIRESGPPSVGTVAQVGDRVDLLGYFPAQGGRSEPSTRLLIPDVAVYGTGPEGDAGSLMVGVSPEEVRLLQESAQQGARIIIALRSAQADGARLQVGGSFTDGDVVSLLRRD